MQVQGRQRDRLRGVLCPVNQFFSVLGLQRERLERVRHCGRVSGDRCIPHGKARPALVRWELGQAFRRRGHRVREAAQAVRRAVRANAMFRAG